MDVISNLLVKHGCKLPAVISFRHMLWIVRECCHLKAEQSRKVPWLSSSPGLNTPACCIKRPYKQIEKCRNKTLRGDSLFSFYSTHHWSRFKSVRTAPTLTFLTSSVQCDIWGMTLALCMTAPLHLSNLSLCHTDLRTKATWRGPVECNSF